MGKEISPSNKIKRQVERLGSTSRHLGVCGKSDKIDRPGNGVISVGIALLRRTEHCTSYTTKHTTSVHEGIATVGITIHRARLINSSLSVQSHYRAISRA